MKQTDKKKTRKQPKQHGANHYRKRENRPPNPLWNLFEFLDYMCDFGAALGEQQRDNVKEEAAEHLQGMWRKIMILCHPDRHGNSELSQEVTRWLIENRPKYTTKNGPV